MLVQMVQKKRPIAQIQAEPFSSRQKQEGFIVHEQSR